MAPTSPAHARRGLALLLVLIFLVLLSALIIGFFTSVEGEVQAAKNYESGVAVRQLVSSATNVIAGQLVDGTRSTKTRRPPGTAGRIPPGERLAWASQPGLIRTWDDAGNGWKIFKLYSARDMVVDFDRGGRYSVGEKLTSEIPAKWPGQPALYTDLNEPVLVADPAGKIVRDGAKLRASFPIVDPLAFASDHVEGFQILKAPGFGGKTTKLGPLDVPVFDATTDPTAYVSEEHTANPAPMPVAWIYVLKDGTLTAPDASADGGRTAVWSKLPAAFTPSRENPIVGRIAFWADDETCKLNINTASEPTPWDTPRAVTKIDVDYGKYQPAAREYQRFPGHPFSNALSPVLLPGMDLNASMKEEIYRLIPRVGTGGTMSGSISVGTAAAVAPDRDRLFANPDELLFEPKLDPANPGQRLAISNDRTDLPILREKLPPERLRRARFFLTASSRAPEINLYGQPRVSLWPVNKNFGQRTAYDRLAAFCSTVADASGSAETSTRGFYFQRDSATSPRTDYSGIQRNKDLFAYLQTLTAADVPGFGGNFRTKWGPEDRDQILAEIFDYIRCTNLRDPQTPTRQFASNGQVAPIIIRSPRGFDAKGFGRFHTISQFGLHFICTYDSALPRQGLPPSPLIPSGRMVEAAFVFEPFSPSLGWPRLEEKMFIQIAFPTPFTVDGTTLNFRAAGAPLDSRSTLGGIGSCSYTTDRDRGGAGGLRGTIRGLGGGSYPWISTNRARVGVASASFMRFGGGTALVRIYSGTTANPANLVQTMTVTFPPADFPLPDLVTTSTTGANNPLTGAPSASPPLNFWWSFASRYSALSDPPYLPSSTEYSSATRCWPNGRGGTVPGFKSGGMFRKEDVVRSMVPRHGDIRLIAAQTVVAAGEFVPCSSGPNNGQWDDRLNHFAHIFTEPAGTQFSYGFLNEPGGPPGPGLPGSATGDQLTPADYHYARLPEIRPGAGKIFNLWGDFDNGIAQVVDGAYINKPDEGNIAGPQGYPYWSSSFTAPTDIFFSPNRLVPSAGMLGSLPTGVRRTVAGQAHAWETLLFRPEPGHPGSATTSPPDHLLMDLFWMPVIEPYAISEPFSTAGKVNLNYEIAPFNYLKRATALVGALKAEEPLAIPTAALPGSPSGAAKIYKLWDTETNSDGALPNAAGLDAQVRRDWDAAFNGEAPFDKMRQRIDPVATLLPWEFLFRGGQIFRSATQICEQPLLPAGTAAAVASGVPPNLAQFWRDHVVTGDNTRERPYANLYAKLTTRSNSYTIHIRAQVLRHLGPRTGGSWREWREDGDKQVAEIRGSTLLERYIDPADPTMLDFALQPSATVDNAYRTRIIATKKFTP